MDAGLIVLTAFVSPFRVDRTNIRSLVNKDGYDGELIEVFCNSSLSRCEERDTKGLYSKARDGIIPDFTGISSPYETPECPELMIDTENQSIEDCVKQVITYLEKKDIIPNSF